MYKTTFILHTKYHTQLKKLSPEQVGLLTLGCFHYAETGELPTLDDAAADMLLSVICQQMDTDMKKYEEICQRRSEAASKAGKASAEKRSRARALAMNSENIEPHPLTTTAAPVETESSEDIADPETPALDGKLIQIQPSGTPGTLTMRINENTYPSVYAEIVKFETLAKELFHKYAHRQPTVYDMQQVFDYSYKREERDDAMAIAVCDPDKTALLYYVFDIAAKNDKVNWNYINGIYHNYAQRGIHTVMDAERDNWEYHHGKLG